MCNKIIQENIILVRLSSVFYFSCNEKLRRFTSLIHFVANILSIPQKLPSKVMDKCHIALFPIHFQFYATNISRVPYSVCMLGLYGFFVSHKKLKNVGKKYLEKCLFSAVSFRVLFQLRREAMQIPTVSICGQYSLNNQQKKEINKTYFYAIPYAVLNLVPQGYFILFKCLCIFSKMSNCT